MNGSTAVRSTLALTCVLAWLAGNAQADFGAGTITFEESQYTLYEWGNISNTSTVTVADDLAIGTNQAFKVSTIPGDPSGDVYVRMGFDRSNANNLGGTLGSLDSGDIPAVFENTSRSATGITENINYRYDKNEPEGPGSDVDSLDAAGEEARWAYTSKETPHLEGGNSEYIITDAIASGYEAQAGAFFVRAAYQNSLGADTGYEDRSGAVNSSDNYTDNDDWESFIIEYSGADVTSATGEIWDIDVSNGAEGFNVKAYDSGGVVIGTESSPTGLSETDANSLNARPWAWSFSNLSSPIAKIVFTKTDPAKTWPLAFNNFNPVSASGFVATVPEPSSLLAFGGIFSLAILRRRHGRVRR